MTEVDPENRERDPQLLAQEGRQLGWYAHLVYNKSLIGSLFTLIHLPSMLAFLSLVLLGTLTIPQVEPLVLLLSFVVVALLLYGEHMLDDMTRVGKPWNTVFGDTTLLNLAAIIYISAGVIGFYATIRFASPLPIVGVLIGMGFCLLYGFEIWRFHTVKFGALGMAAIPVFSYWAQAISTNSSLNPFIAAMLAVFGFSYGYVMSALYEHTKTRDHQIAWRLLGVHFITFYALVGLIVALRIA